MVHTHSRIICSCKKDKVLYIVVERSLKYIKWKRKYKAAYFVSYFLCKIEDTNTYIDICLIWTKKQWKDKQKSNKCGYL